MTRFAHIATLFFAFFSIATAQTPQIDSLKAVIEVQPENVDAMYQLGRIYHQMGGQGDEDAVEEAQKMFESVLAIQKDNAEALVYLGSTLTMRGRDAMMPWTKLDFVEKGCDKMDKAVLLAPNDISIRMTRGMNNINLPGFFNRLPYTIEDLSYIRDFPGFPHLPQAMQQRVLYNLGVAFKRSEKFEDARAMFEKAAAIDDSTDLGKQANDNLTAMNK